MLRMKLYMKPGCWLCDMAQDLLNGLAARYEFSVEHVDISIDEALYDLYRFDIPVIEFEDGATLHGHIKRKDLVRMIEAHLKGQQ